MSDTDTLPACTRCRRDIPRDAEHFYPASRGRADGFGSWCKECQKETATQRQRKVAAQPGGREKLTHGVFLSRLRHRPGFLEMHAASMALTRLRMAHPDEYDALFAEAADELRAEADIA